MGSLPSAFFHQYLLLGFLMLVLYGYKAQQELMHPQLTQPCPYGCILSCSQCSQQVLQGASPYKQLFPSYWMISIGWIPRSVGIIIYGSWWMLPYYFPQGLYKSILPPAAYECTYFKTTLLTFFFFSNYIVGKWLLIFKCCSNLHFFDY